MLICDMDRAYGGAAGRELVERLVELRRAGAPGTERVLGIGMDSTELGVDPVNFADAYQLRTTAGRLDLLTPNWVWVPRSWSAWCDLLVRRREQLGMIAGS